MLVPFLDTQNIEIISQAKFKIFYKWNNIQPKFIVIFNWYYLFVAYFIHSSFSGIK